MTPAGTQVADLWVAKEKSNGKLYRSGNGMSFFETEKGLRQSLKRNIKRYPYFFEGKTADDYEILQCVLVVAYVEEGD